MVKRLLGVGILSFLILLGISALPRVSDPNPLYQTALEYDDILGDLVPFPNDEHDRVRSRMVLLDDRVIYEDGPTDMIMNGHSTRKSFLSLLYGIAVEQGLIDLDKSLKELGIDENISLTEQEKTATIRDLLMSRSGVYLPAKGEHDSQITDRPKRGSHKPGTYFFSNNFDFNALGTIFIQETGHSIGEFMEEYLAKPLGMQDFNANNVVMGDPWFFPGNGSFHEMYYMYISTRDFARIGAMVANDGRWNGVQVVPEAWIKISTTPHSDLKLSHIDYGRYDAFGYVWWIDHDAGTIWTDGYGGHFMLIDPVRSLVLVERNFTGNSYLSITRWLMRSDRVGPGPADLQRAHDRIVTLLDDKD